MTTATPLYSRLLTRPGRATARAIAAGANVALAMLIIFSAYGGAIDPTECVLAALAAMALPLLLIASILTLIIDLIFWRKAAIAIAAAWIAALPPILEFAPLNIPSPPLSPQQQERTVTFMTYNVLHFWDFRGEQKELTSNLTIDRILQEDPDIVSLQECEMMKEWPLWHITSHQLKELARRYPFRAVGVAEQFTLLSKYPFTVDRIQIPPHLRKNVSFYRISINGSVLHLANCHLQSIGLSPDDKQFYAEILSKAPETSDQLKDEVDAVKSRIISKLRDAFVERKHQALYIRSVVDSIGGNWIVAGDFNDVPACYALRTIKGDDMIDIYARTALGPRITFHDKLFYFRIDHMLCKGNFRPIAIRRPRIPSSDHYPLIATLLFDEE